MPLKNTILSINPAGNTNDITRCNIKKIEATCSPIWIKIKYSDSDFDLINIEKLTESDIDRIKNYYEEKEHSHILMEYF